MNRKDVIENLKNRLNDLHNGYQTYLEHGGKQDIETENDIEALNMAIEALKKQTAIPPNIVDWSGLYDDGLTGFKCPSCDSTIEYLDDHCECCGQAIDWSKEEG